MLNTSDSAGLARPLRKILLATLVSFALVGFGSGVASAQEDPTTPSSDTSTPTSSESSTPPSSSASEEVPAPPAPPEKNEQEQPGNGEEEPKSVPPAVTAANACGEGIGFVDVFIQNPNDTEVTYKVVISNLAGDTLQTQTVKVAAGDTGSVTFEDVPAGEIGVNVKGDDDTTALATTIVDRCKEIGPVDDQLQVFVRCVNGEGLVTIRVFNTEGESRTYTVSVDDIQIGDPIELGQDEYAVVIDEAVAPDGTYKVRVVAEGIDHSETVTVKCEPAPPTSTTTPAPQPRPAPSDDDGLASTGAAVGGMALLGVVALGLGGGLVVASRRRRAAQPDETEA